MIIITGASGGVGKYLLESYLEKGEKVVGTYHSRKPDDALIDHYAQVDVTRFKEVETWINGFSQRGNLTLINCSGITYNAFTHKSDVEQWASVIETNLIGTYHVIRAVLPLMRQEKFGRIINFSSVVAKKPTPGISAYTASKSALWGMSKSIAVENGALGITCNCINLGYADLGMGVEKVPPEFQKIIKGQIPSGKFCSGEDIFKSVEYLRATEYINGSDIDLSGGLI